MKLSLVVPIYNEYRQLPEVLDSLFRIKFLIEVEWIFVDDCSTDGSKDILREFQKKYHYRLFEQPINLGKGAAVIRGFQESTGDIIMIQDADFEYNPENINELIQPILENKADVVYGSRFKKNSFQVHRTYHYFVNRFLTFLSNLLSGIYLTDMETCYKVFRADLLKSMKLESKRFGIEIELTAYIAKTKARVYELPIQYFPRTRLQGKKINWKDGVAALRHVIYFNLFKNKSNSFLSLPLQYDPEKQS